MFEKVDDHTYAAAMDYDLADYNGDAAAIDCQLTVAGLTGVQNAYDADGSYLRTRLDGPPRPAIRPTVSVRFPNRKSTAIRCPA